jgi:hypothetical protein
MIPKQLFFLSISLSLMLPFHAAEEQRDYRKKRDRPDDYKERRKRRRYHFSEEVEPVKSDCSSTHDKRLTGALEYFEESRNGVCCYNIKNHVAQSFKETAKVSVSWRSYRHLKNIFLMNAPRDMHCLSDYIQEQYTLNKPYAIKCRYTALMVLASPTISLPAELCQKIVLLMDPAVLVFKADFLVMFGMVCTAQKPLQHLQHIYDTYNQLI